MRDFLEGEALFWIQFNPFLRRIAFIIIIPLPIFLSLSRQGLSPLLFPFGDFIQETRGKEFKRIVLKQSSSAELSHLNIRKISNLFNWEGEIEEAQIVIV